jgi:hypothetical protein
MRSIKRYFLRAKHWQIFVMLFGAGLLGDLLVIASNPPPAESWSDLGNVGKIYVELAFLIMICFLGWMWSMGSFLNSIVKPKLRMGTGFFCFRLFYPPVYGVAFLAVLERRNAHLLEMILPFHLLAMVCLLYQPKFVSKSLVMAETGKSKAFRDYAGLFLLIWFFPIGVWFIQPRINQLYATRSDIGSSTAS